MRDVLRSPIVRLATVVFLAACAAKAANERPYIAPTNDTITSQTDVRTDDRTHVVTVYNRSSVPITVWNVALAGCENVRGQCGPRRTNIRVFAGGSATAARIEPDNPNRSFSYRFSFSWRPDSSTRGAAVTALASADPNVSATFRELTPTDFQRHSARIAKIRPRPESLFMAPGERLDFSDIRVLVLDSKDSVLGFTRFVGMRMNPGAALQVLPSMSAVARRPGRASLHYELAAPAQSMLASPVAETELPILVAYRFGDDAPTFVGNVLDADSKAPLACARLSVEDSTNTIVNSMRSDALGAFTLKAPRPGTYRLRVETPGWAPWYSAPTPVAATEEKRADHLVQFTEQSLNRSQFNDPDNEPARPASVRFEPGPTRARNAATPVIQGVTMSGSAALPILSVQTPLPPQTLWTQFLVDSSGRADTTTIVFPTGTAANVRSTVRYVLPRVRFTPARESGRATCELIRMQVNLSPR